MERRDHKLRLGESRRDTTFLIIGLSRLGLFTAIRLLGAGYRVVGYDRSSYVASKILQGRSLDDDQRSSAILRRHAREGDFSLVEGIDSAMSEMKANVVMICEKAPANDRKVPQVRQLYDVADSLGKSLRSGVIVALQTLAPPGTARGVMKRCEELSGLSCGKGFDFVYVPSPLDMSEDFPDQDAPRVIAGSTPEAISFVSEIFRSAQLGECYTASSLEAAELTVMHVHAGSCLRQALRAEFGALCANATVGLEEVERISNILAGKELRELPAAYGRNSAAVLGNLLEASRSRGINLPLCQRARDVCWSLPTSIARTLVRNLKSQGLTARSSAVIIGSFRELDCVEKSSHPELEISSVLEKAKVQVKLSRPWDGDARRSELGVHLHQLRAALKGSKFAVVLASSGHDMRKISDLNDIAIYDFTK
jgi:UDP-N-acetyl-D-mannosaminuronate dehydrogenase